MSCPGVIVHSTLRTPYLGLVSALYVIISFADQFSTCFTAPRHTAPQPILSLNLQKMRLRPEIGDHDPGSSLCQESSMEPAAAFPGPDSTLRQAVAPHVFLLVDLA